MSREWLDTLIQRPNTADDLKYERAEIIGKNSYHGNILQKSGLTSQRQKILAANLAMCVERIEKPDIKQNVVQKPANEPHSVPPFCPLPVLMLWFKALLHFCR